MCLFYCRWWSLIWCHCALLACGRASWLGVSYAPRFLFGAGATEGAPEAIAAFFAGRASPMSSLGSLNPSCYSLPDKFAAWSERVDQGTEAATGCPTESEYCFCDFNLDSALDGTLGATTEAALRKCTSAAG